MPRAWLPDHPFAEPRGAPRLINRGTGSSRWEHASPALLRDFDWPSNRGPAVRALRLVVRALCFLHLALRRIGPRAILKSVFGRAPAAEKASYESRFFRCLPSPVTKPSCRWHRNGAGEVTGAQGYSKRGLP